MPRVTLESLGAPYVLRANTYYWKPCRKAKDRRSNERDKYNEVYFWLAALDQYLNLNLYIDGTTAYHKGELVFDFDYRETTGHVYKHQYTKGLLSLISNLQDPEKEQKIEFVKRITSRYKLKDYYNENEFWMLMDYEYEKYKATGKLSNIYTPDLEDLVWRSEKRRKKVLKHVSFQRLLELLDNGIKKETILNAVELMENNLVANYINFDKLLELLNRGIDKNIILRAAKILKGREKEINFETALKLANNELSEVA